MSALFAIREKDPAAQAAMQRWDEMKGDRAHHERDWEAIAELIRPQRGGFSSDDHTTRSMSKPLSSAPISAQVNFSSGLYGSLTNPANRWMGLETNDRDLNAWKPAKIWLDAVTDRILDSFRPAVSPFYDATTQVFSDLAAFGNGANYDEVMLEEGRILDVTLSLAEVCFEIDAYGRVVEVVRRFKLRPAAAMSMFKGNLPAKLVKMAEEGSVEKVNFYHHVLRNDAWRQRALGVKGKRWISRYACEMEQTLLRESGYDEMPFHAPRWDVESGAIYGTGPGYMALPAARAHNRMDDATMRAAQFAADPTILAPDRSDWPLNGRIRPGNVVYGGVSMNGSKMLDVLQTGGSINLTLEEKQAKIDEIRDAFHYTLMNLAGRTGMTATEVMTINEERQRLWAPYQGRVQGEYLAPKVMRRFSLLWRAGQLPPPPPEMEGASLQVSYQSAAAAAQKASEGTALMRILEDIGPLAQAKPRLLDRIDEDGLLETLIDARGAPGRAFRSREEADQLAQQRAERAQMAEAMQAAQSGAGIAKDLHQAGMIDPQGGAQ